MADPFALIAAERVAMADVLESLTHEQWDTESLCDGWTVRAVAAHLVMPFRLGKGALVMRMLKYRFNFDRLADEYAREAATEPTATLVGALRDNAQHRFTPPGLGPMAPLTDIVVHGLDIRVPLGMDAATPDGVPPAAPAATTEVLDFLMTARATRGFIPKGRVDGLSFASTDTGWSHGTGPAVRGPAPSLALAITGRQAGLDALDGDGVGELRRRITAP